MELDANDREIKKQKEQLSQQLNELNEYRSSVDNEQIRQNIQKQEEEMKQKELEKEK